MTAFDIGGGHYAEEIELTCERCEKTTYRTLATHGGDMFDVEAPILCQDCHTAAIEAARAAWRTALFCDCPCGCAKIIPVGHTYCIRCESGQHTEDEERYEGDLPFD